VKFNRVPEKMHQEKVRKALVQSQVRFNRVSEKVPEKVWEALVQSQVRRNRVPEKVPEKIPEKVGAVGEALGLWCKAEVFPALGFAARFRKNCKNETLRLLGIPPKLIFCPSRKLAERHSDGRGSGVTLPASLTKCRVTWSWGGHKSGAGGVDNMILQHIPPWEHDTI